MSRVAVGAVSCLSVRRVGAVVRAGVSRAVVEVVSSVSVRRVAVGAVARGVSRRRAVGDLAPAEADQ